MPCVGPVCGASSAAEEFQPTVEAMIDGMLRWTEPKWFGSAAADARGVLGLLASVTVDCWCCIRALRLGMERAWGGGGGGGGGRSR